MNSLLEVIEDLLLFILFLLMLGLGVYICVFVCKPYLIYLVTLFVNLINIIYVMTIE